MLKLTPEDLQPLLRSLPGWSITPDGLRKQFHLRSFADAVAAVTRVGFEAEAANHHPEVQLNWKRVTFTLATPGAGGITQKDVALARRIEALLHNA
jgi:4a-hydroxytetrahydrobiopterin dehydratase